MKIAELDKLPREERRAYWESLSDTEKAILWSQIRKYEDRKRLISKIKHLLPYIIMAIIVALWTLWNNGFVKQIFGV